MPFSDWVPNPDRKLKALLLEVFGCYKADLSQEFINYDTTYLEEHRDATELMDGGQVRYIEKKYPLPSGKLLVLLLQTIDERGSHIWTTVRRHTPEKATYYRSMRGKMFECVVQEEEK